MIRLWVALGVLMIAWGIVGKGDYRDAVAQHDYQCEMIAEGRWPESVNRGCEQ